MTPQRDVIDRRNDTTVNIGMDNQQEISNMHVK